jgi:cell division GTPase FtsZ
MDFIGSRVQPDANIIFGTTFDESLTESVQVSLIVTGTDIIDAGSPPPRRMAPPLDGVAQGAGGEPNKGAEGKDGEGGSFFSQFKIF